MYIIDRRTNIRHLNQTIQKHYHNKLVYLVHVLYIHTFYIRTTKPSSCGYYYAIQRLVRTACLWKVIEQENWAVPYDTAYVKAFHENDVTVCHIGSKVFRNPKINLLITSNAIRNILMFLFLVGGLNYIHKFIKTCLRDHKNIFW